VPRTDKLATLCANCQEILGASTSWSSNGLSRPVWIYLYLDNGLHVVQIHTLSIFPTFKRIPFLLPPLQLGTDYSTLGLFVVDLKRVPCNNRGGGARWRSG